jgi:hypothetical protein
MDAISGVSVFPSIIRGQDSTGIEQCQKDEKDS